MVTVKVRVSEEFAEFISVFAEAEGFAQEPFLRSIIANHLKWELTDRDVVPSRRRRTDASTGERKAVKRAQNNTRANAIATAIEAARARKERQSQRT